MSQTRDSMGGPANYYQTSLEPMQMLQAYRSGQPVINHIFRPQQQFLPQGLPSFTPPPAVQASPYPWMLQQPQAARPQNGFIGGGPGGDGAPGGVGTDGGADGSGGAGGGGGGGK